ncbi:head-tail connector protein [Peribacillus frigoritolerans]|nr:head-tail connector protein [Peribacillus frigoritolerans]
MIITLNEMKQYLRLEVADVAEDALLNALLLTAEEYIKNATGFKFETNVPETAKLIVRLLVSHWFENRAVVTSSNLNKIDFTVNALLMQLTYTHTEDVVAP